MKDITTEEAIQIMRNHICWIENKTVKQAIEKVLNELEKYKELYISTLGHSLNNSIKQNNKYNNDLEALNEGWKIELEKKDKIINAMTDQLVGLTIWDDKKQEPVMLMTEEEVRKFFEEEVKDE